MKEIIFDLLGVGKNTKTAFASEVRIDLLLKSFQFFHPEITGLNISFYP